MKNTTFVSAGAGSGKTYRLTQDIAQMIIDGKYQAEQIILTTFTEAAAKDLREKYGKDAVVTDDDFSDNGSTTTITLKAGGAKFFQPTIE